MAKFHGRCWNCGNSIRIGEYIKSNGFGGYMHADPMCEEATDYDDWYDDLYYLDRW